MTKSVPAAAVSSPRYRKSDCNLCRHSRLRIPRAERCNPRVDFLLSNFALSIARLLPESNRNIHLFSASIHGYVDGIAGTMMIEHQTYVELVRDFLAVDSHDDVASNSKPSHPGQH